VWTASYDSNPPNDAFTPAGEAIVRRVKAG
jgi:hypothetical protein